MLPHPTFCPKKQGIDIPFVYNSSGYERVESLKQLTGLIVIYLPDYKYAISKDAKRYSSCPDYPEVALKAIDEMLRQQPECVIEKGIMRKGVIIRHMLLPGKVIESKIAVKKLYDRYGDKLYYSLMSQYTPLPHVADYPEINRKVTEAEYQSLVSYAAELGIEKAFIQTGEAASESFIPAFDYEGV